MTFLVDYKYKKSTKTDNFLGELGQKMEQNSNGCCYVLIFKLYEPFFGG